MAERPAILVVDDDPEVLTAAVGEGAGVVQNVYQYLGEAKNSPSGIDQQRASTSSTVVLPVWRSTPSSKRLRYQLHNIKRTETHFGINLCT